MQRSRVQENKLTRDGVMILLSKLPRTIWKQEQKVLDLEEALRVIEVQLEIEELRIRSEVLSATDPKGKPLYTNEQSRRAAIESRKREDEAYLKRTEEWRQAKREWELAKAELHYHMNRLKAARTIGEMMALGF